MDPPTDPSAPARKFQTRRGVQRTSKADREAFARAEERRQAEVQREVERATASATSRGAYTPRSQGALLGNAAERTRNENSGGVFGAATGRGRGAGRGKGRGGDLGSLVGVKEEVAVEGVDALVGGAEQSRAGTESGKASIGDGEKKPTKTRAKATTERKKTLKPTKKDGPVMLSSDEEGLAEEGLRRDIETIEISSDEDEDGTENGDDDEGPVSATAKGKRRDNRNRAQAPRAKMALRPVRAPREAREMDELNSFSSRRRIQRSLRDRNKAYGGEDQIGGVPVDDYEDDVMDVDEVGPATDFSLQGLESQTKSSRKKSLSLKDKDPKHASETIEERTERLRYAEDVRKIRHELSAMPPVVAPTQDVEMTEPDRLDREMASGRDGKMYLFQFPPLTPMLVDPAHKDDVVEIKQEPGADGAKPDEAVGTAAATAQGLSKKEKDKAPQIKKEDHDSKEDAKAQIAAAAERVKMLTADGARLPPGFAGTLNVHKSGKVTLEWGETNMEVRWGSEVDFLQDVVLAAGDEGEDAKAGEERSVFALGQVHKKLVVIPDWQKIYE
jgi:DNA-directed RNA polymerase III subunit RPC4